MQPIYRRDFIRTTAAGAIAAILPHSLSARQERVNPLLKRIDINRLGPNGEITVGFLLTLNPRPCSHFNAAARTSQSTAPEQLKKIFRHLTLHAVKPEDIKEACREGQRLWQEQNRQTQHSLTP